MKLEKRVKGIVGSMEELSFNKEDFEVIWSEGAIDSMGFENGINYWNQFLKKDGYMVVTCPSWIAKEHPTEVENFWSNAGSKLDTIEYNVNVMQKSGYSHIATFTLPEKCWIENYFIPRQNIEKELLEQYNENKVVKDYIESDNYEMELYLKYKRYYGYVFYICKKI